MVADFPRVIFGMGQPKLGVLKATSSSIQYVISAQAEMTLRVGSIIRNPSASRQPFKKSSAHSCGHWRTIPEDPLRLRVRKKGSPEGGEGVAIVDRAGLVASGEPFLALT